MELENSLSKVEYLTTFNAFIYGYVVSRYFQEWGRLINHRRTIHFSAEHFAWSFYGFALLIDLWWSGWLRLRYIDRTPFSFYVSVLSPFVLYLISSVYFPSLEGRTIFNLKKYYLFQRRKGFFYYGVLFLTIIVASLFVSGANKDTLFGICALVVVVVAFLLSSRKVEIVAIVLLYLLLIGHGLLMPRYTEPTLWMIKGFSFSEYVVLFITFIYGFIVARFLEGWTYFVINRTSIRINASFIAWTLVVFGLTIDYWWGMWERSTSVGRDYLYFLVSLLPVVGFYLIGALLFPKEKPAQGTFVDYFVKNARVIYVLLMLIFISDFMTSRIVGMNVMFGAENLFRMLAVILCGVGIVRNNHTTNQVVLGFAWLLLILHSITDYWLN